MDSSEDICRTMNTRTEVTIVRFDILKVICPVINLYEARRLVTILLKQNPEISEAALGIIERVETPEEYREYFYWGAPRLEKDEETKMTQDIETLRQAFADDLLTADDFQMTADSS
jgi:hypothetical protein